MPIKDVAELLLKATERVDFYWNFYVVVVIAVIGWLVSLKRTLSVSMKVLVSSAYLVAAAMNLLGLYGSYTFAEALRTDLLRMGASASLPDTRLVLEQHSFLPQRMAAFWIHLTVGVAVLVAVWFVRVPESESTPVARDRENTGGTAQHEKTEA